MINNLINPSLIHLDDQSVKELCTPSNQVMVYGFTHCGYGAICKKLSENTTIVQKLLECSLGNYEVPFKTIEGRQIEQIRFVMPIEDTAEANIKICNRMCKTGLVNIILENYKRNKEALPLIPIIFCIDSEDAPMDSTRMSSRDAQLNSFLTHHELRRAYKLCSEMKDPEIAEIANETFKFTKLMRDPNKSDAYSLLQIQPCWQRDGEKWTSSWIKRLETKKIQSPNKISWRFELQNAISNYNNKSNYFSLIK